jgi:hypothetical protein
MYFRILEGFIKDFEEVLDWILKDLNLSGLIGKIPLKLGLQVEFSKTRGLILKVTSHAHWIAGLFL